MLKISFILKLFPTPFIQNVISRKIKLYIIVKERDFSLRLFINDKYVLYFLEVKSAIYFY